MKREPFEYRAQEIGYTAQAVVNSIRLLVRVAFWFLLGGFASFIPLLLWRWLGLPC